MSMLLSLAMLVSLTAPALAAPVIVTDSGDKEEAGQLVEQLTEVLRVIWEQLIKVYNEDP